MQQLNIFLLLADCVNFTMTCFHTQNPNGHSLSTHHLAQLSTQTQVMDNKSTFVNDRPSE